jgi:hypothetical protein
MKINNKSELILFTCQEISHSLGFFFRKAMRPREKLTAGVLGSRLPVALCSFSIDLPIDSVIPIEVYPLHQRVALKTLIYGFAIEVLNEAGTLFIIFSSSSRSHVLSFICHFR